jgi:hypothetical protein
MGLASLHRMVVFPALLAMYLPFCAREIRPAAPPGALPVSLWKAPDDLTERDLFHGPWGPERAPDPEAVYTLVQRKHSGVNPGMTVRDPLGREWSVKQAPPAKLRSEVQVEVVLSRVLSAVGYHQPPVYYLPAFTLEDDWGTHQESAGRFRLKDKALDAKGEWYWQENPFVGTEPYQGLLAILMLFNSSDLKNNNNTIYEYRRDGVRERWYVVRDLGTALGNTGRLAPLKNDADVFARERFITAINDQFVTFNYRGWHQELVRERITPEDVAWACDLLARLTERQWEDAFRAAGYSPDVAGRFTTALQSRIAEGQAVRHDRRPTFTEAP